MNKNADKKALETLEAIRAENRRNTIKLGADLGLTRNQSLEALDLAMNAAEKAFASAQLALTPLASSPIQHALAAMLCLGILAEGTSQRSKELKERLELVKLLQQYKGRAQ